MTFAGTSRLKGVQSTSGAVPSPNPRFRRSRRRLKRGQREPRVLGTPVIHALSGGGAVSVSRGAPARRKEHHMTRDKSFKRLVRARMDKTGESYTAARAALLAAAEPSTRTEEPVLTTSDAEIRRRTGRGWEEWFDLLDEWHADELAHKEIARRVADELEIKPLVWEAQAVTVSYERARGLRAVGQRTDGFAITASKTVAVPVN